MGRKQWCDKKVTDEGDKTAAEFCTSCGCVEGPGPSPPDEDCKDDTEKIKLTNQEKKLKCKQIKQKELCGETVKNEGDKTAANFCTSCGCGGDPTPSPPADCKDEKDKIVLTDESWGELKCKQIENKELCGEKVKNEVDKTAVDFCTSCGCGGPAPTPSPPDEDCTLGDSDTLQLTTKNNKQTCAKI